MELKPTLFHQILSSFHSVWSLEKIRSMTIDQYSNLNDHNSFCYWLEYGSKENGAIGAIALHKFELWKPKKQVLLADKRFSTDGEYIWNTRKGSSAAEAFQNIKEEIIQIISFAQQADWEGVESIRFHAIGKWKIAFMFSNNRFLPIYSKRALLSISIGLGGEFNYYSRVSDLQRYILTFKNPQETIDDFAYRVYSQFAEKPDYYIFGSKYGDGEGHDTIPKINDFIDNQCVAIGWLDHIDFTSYMGAEPEEIKNLLEKELSDEKITFYKIFRHFKLFSKIKEGDFIAVKSHGQFNNLTIIAYAKVVKKDGSIYKYDDENLGHCINVEFLDYGFRKSFEYTYAETIHHLTPGKDKGKFYDIFGWYVDLPQYDSVTKESELPNIPEIDDPTEEDIGYNEKDESPIERKPIGSTTVTRIHNKIQNRFLDYLSKVYPTDLISGEKNYIDAKRVSTNELVIYEIKPIESVIYCIREGIGQLLDYYRCTETGKNKKIAIVGPNKPEQPQEIAFIEMVKNHLTIPFSYIAFDYKNQVAEEF